MAPNYKVLQSSLCWNAAFMVFVTIIFLKMGLQYRRWHFTGSSCKIRSCRNKCFLKTWCKSWFMLRLQGWGYSNLNLHPPLHRDACFGENRMSDFGWLPHTNFLIQKMWTLHNLTPFPMQLLPSEVLDAAIQRLTSPGIETNNLWLKPD